MSPTFLKFLLKIYEIFVYVYHTKSLTELIYFYSNSFVISSVKKTPRYTIPDIKIIKNFIPHLLKKM